MEGCQMQKIRISTDSPADIPGDVRKKLNISVLPVTIVSEGHEYRDGYDISPEEFSVLLEKVPMLPSTSQVPLTDYTRLYEQSWRSGYSHLVHFSINSKASGCYQASMLARTMFYEEYPEAEQQMQIHLLDSKSYSIVYGWAVIETARAVQAGAGIEEVLAVAEDWLKHSRCVVVPKDLRFVRKSGRISGAAAFVGDAIGLKPAMTFEDGEVKVLSKIRGEKKVQGTMLDIVKKNMEPGSPYILAYTADKEAFEKLRLMALEAFGKEPEYILPLGCAIQINIGTNSIGIAYRKKTEE